MRTSSTRRTRIPAVLALLVLSTSATSAMADNGVAITDPTSNPVETWQSGNMQSVSFTYPNTGGPYNYNITIYKSSDSSIEFLSTSGYVGNGNPFSVNFYVPNATKTDTTGCTIKVKITKQSDGSSVGSDTCPVKIYTP